MPLEGQANLVALEQITEANRLFETFSTGTTSAEDYQSLLSYAIHIPPIVQGAFSLTGDWRQESFEHWARTHPPHDLAFSHAHLALNAACDALMSFYSQVVKGAGITAYSAWPLLRNAIESALVSRWILGDLTKNGVLKRGYAIDWKNAKESLDCVENMLRAEVVLPLARDEMRRKAKGRWVDVLELGRLHRLLKNENSNGFRKPLLPLPGGKELFSGMPGAERFKDMEWLYNIMSGVAHGFEWALIGASNHSIIQEYENVDAQGATSLSGVVESQNTPNTVALVLPLIIALAQVKGATNNFLTARSMPPETV